MFSFLNPLSEVFQVVIAAVASIVFLGLAGLTLAASAAALTITSPLFIIFSPILVPATIATAVLISGFTAGGTLGAMAVALIRMGLKLFGGSSPAKTLFSLQPKVNYEGNFKGSWGGGSSLQAMSNFSYGGTWTASWGGKTFTGSFGDKSAGGSSSAPAASTPAPAAAPPAPAASTPAPAAAPAPKPPG
ncbi:oleosin-B2 isoform X2 [Capsella rubella]|uniref:oleosin-B2 isoform X2 n=1 Tax=Capsella rubella TaxID=81985 RepID=UPI000CD5738A|nr:oleosin-B2 isoform X2 [Capsella rubella]